MGVFVSAKEQLTVTSVSVSFKVELLAVSFQKTHRSDDSLESVFEVGGKINPVIGIDPQSLKCGQGSF